MSLLSPDLLPRQNACFAVVAAAAVSHADSVLLCKLARAGSSVKAQQQPSEKNAILERQHVQRVVNAFMFYKCVQERLDYSMNAVSYGILYDSYELMMAL